MNHDRESEDSDDVSNDYGSEEIGILTTFREKAYLREKKKYHDYVPLVVVFQNPISE